MLQFSDRHRHQRVQCKILREQQYYCGLEGLEAHKKIWVSQSKRMMKLKRFRR